MRREHVLLVFVFIKYTYYLIPSFDKKAKKPNRTPKLKWMGLFEYYCKIDVEIVYKTLALSTALSRLNEYIPCSTR